MGKAPKFNPSFQTDDESIANFIVRRYQLDIVIDALTIAADSDTDAPRFLVTAPRGAGKTSLCRRVVAETRISPKLRKTWQPIYLGEESYTVTTPGEFFLECLFQLNDQATSPELTKHYKQASEARSEEQLIELALGSLRDFARTTGKRLLVIVENFHTILNEQIQDSKNAREKGLIDALDESTLFAVLATSITQASDNYATPFPQHYHRIELPPLSLGECRELWESMTGTEVNEKKLRPLQILTGGSPRLLQILAEFTQTPSLHDLLTNLNYLIDQYTEYFKSQLDALATLERKVFVTLLDMWDPSTAKQVAEVARVNTNTASAMLARLTDRGAVIKEPGLGRTAIYVAAERLFNIYYLMRRRSHPSSRVRALVSFMMAYYDSDELVDTTARLMREACDIEPARRGDYHSTFDAIMSYSSDTVRHQILARTSPEFLQSYRDDQTTSSSPAKESLRKPSESEQEATIRALIQRIEKAIDENNLDTAYDLLIEGIQLDGEVSDLWIRLSFLELQRDNVAAAIEAGEKARTLTPEDPWGHAVLGQALALSGRTDEAEASYIAATERDPGQPLALYGLASMLERRGDIETALELFKVAQDAQALTDLTRYSYGMLLNRTGRKSDAEIILREGADEPENHLSRHALVEFLEEQDRQDEGVLFLEQAAKVQGRWETWAELGQYLVDRTSLFPAAQDAFRRAIDMGGDQPYVYVQLAEAILQSGGAVSAAAAVAAELVDRFPQLSRAWGAAGQIYEAIDDEIEAETAYRTALEQEDGEFVLIPLARLLQKQTDGRSEARQLLRQAIDSTEGRRKCIPSRELAELLIHNGDDIQASEALETALRANEHCVCCLTLRGDICRRGGETAAAERHYRATLDLDSTAIAALTGLAQLVSTEEATELIGRAIEANPEDPRVLLARARLSPHDHDVQLKDAQAALALEPKFIEAHLYLASVEANRGYLYDAIGHLETVLAELPSRRELIPNFVSAAMAIAKLDEGQCLSDLLARHENAATVEPLAAAVKILRGEKPMVAKEITDVAWDIIMRR